MSRHDAAVATSYCIAIVQIAYLEGDNQVLLRIPLLRATRIERAAGAHALLQVPSHIPQDAATLWSSIAVLILLIERLHA